MGEARPAHPLLSRRGLLRGGAGAAALYVASRAGFHVWMRAAVPDDAPCIALSLSTAWPNAAGITDTTYQQALVRAGARLVRLEPPGATDAADQADAGTAQALLERSGCQGLVLTGGGDVDPARYGGRPADGSDVDRDRDAFEIALIDAALDRALPILGICRGCQLMNVALGGTLRSLRDDPALEPTHFGLAGHPVAFAPGSRLARIHGVGALAHVQSFHHQAIDRPAPGVFVSARGPDGVAEAIELDRPDRFAVGVQWHPELDALDPVQNRLFLSFVTEAREASRAAG